MVSDDDRTRAAVLDSGRDPGRKNQPRNKCYTKNIMLTCAQCISKVVHRVFIYRYIYRRCAIWTICVRNCLKINNLRRGRGVFEASIVIWGATLKIFFAYFSSSVSYGFCDFQNMAQKQPCIVHIVVKHIKY